MNLLSVIFIMLIAQASLAFENTQEKEEAGIFSESRELKLLEKPYKINPRAMICGVTSFKNCGRRRSSKRVSFSSK